MDVWGSQVMRQWRGNLRTSDGQLADSRSGEMRRETWCGERAEEPGDMVRGEQSDFTHCVSLQRLLTLVVNSINNSSACAQLFNANLTELLRGAKEAI